VATGSTPEVQLISPLVLLLLVGNVGTVGLLVVPDRVHEMPARPEVQKRCPRSCAFSPYILAMWIRFPPAKAALSDWSKCCVTDGRRRRWSDDEKLRIVAESFEAPRRRMAHTIFCWPNALQSGDLRATKSQQSPVNLGDAAVTPFRAIAFG